MNTSEIVFYKANYLFRFSFDNHRDIIAKEKEISLIIKL